MEPKESRKLFREQLKKWVSENCPEWLEAPAVKRWIAGVPSEKTRKNIRVDFPLFLGFVKMCPTEIVEMRKTDLLSDDPDAQNRFEDFVASFKSELAEHHYSKWSIKTYLARVMSFFNHAHVPLRLTKTQSKIEVSEHVKRTRRRKRPPTNEEVRLMYRATPDIETRVALLFGYQNGFAPIDISELRVEHLKVRPETPEDFVFFQLWREKTDIPVMTCLGPDLIADLKLMLRLESWPTKGFLFHTKSVDPETGEYTRVREDVLSSRIKEAARILGPEWFKDFKTKDLRDAFNVALLDAMLGDEVKDVLMGHQRRGARSSYPISPNTVVEAYRKVYPRLSVNGVAQRQRGLRNLEERLKVIFAALAAQNPKKEFINILEREWGYTENAIWNQITGGKVYGVSDLESRYKIILQFLRGAI